MKCFLVLSVFFVLYLLFCLLPVYMMGREHRKIIARKGEPNENHEVWKT